MLQNIVKQKREEKGLTQNELCRAANISRATLCKIESGTVNNIRIETARRIADALEERADVIFCI